MIEKLTPIDRLEMYAEEGYFDATLKLWKPQIKKLEKEGFRVEKLHPTTRKGEFRCIILWITPTNRNGVAAKLHDMSHEKSLALWAEKNQSTS